MKFVTFLFASIFLTCNIALAQNGIDDVVVDEDAGFTVIADLDEVFGDDGRNIAFQLAGHPEELNMSIDENHILSFEPDRDWNIPDGVDISVLMIFEDGDVAEDVFNLVVTPVNDAPVIVVNIDDMTVDEDSGLNIIADLDDVFGDIDLDDAQLSFEFAGAPDELNMQINEENHLLFTPDDEWNMEDGVDITVTATDGDGMTVEDVFTLVVTPVNDSPVIVNEIEDLTVDEDSGVSLIADLDDVFGDIDAGDELRFEFGEVPEELNMQINEENHLLFNPDQDYNLPEGVDIAVTATDGEDSFVEDVFNLVVTPVDDDPLPIDITPEALDFGEIMVEDGGELTLTITNTSDEDLRVFDVLIEGDGFSTDFEGDDGGGREFDWEFRRAGANMTVLVRSAQIDDEDLREGDFIGVFTEAGTCGGFAEVEEEGEQIAFPAWGEDEDGAFGFQDGEEIEFRMWNTELGIEIVATDIEVIQGELVYDQGGFGVFNIAGDTPLVGELLEPEDVLDILVHFEPDEAGAYEGVLTVNTSLDDPLDVIEVPLSGVGRVLHNITYYLYFGTYIPFQGPGPVIRITPLGENVAEGEAFIIPDYDLERYNLGESFQIYMDAISGTTVEIEEGGIDEDIEVHLILGNLIIIGGQDGEPYELAGIYSPDDNLADLLWMFADFQVWTTDADSVQINDEEDFEFIDDARMVVSIPLDDEFLAMMDNLNLDYDLLGAAIWLPEEEEWDLNGIVSAEIEIGEEIWFRIGLSHLSIVGGGPDGGFEGDDDRGGEGHFNCRVTQESHSLIIIEATLDNAPLQANDEIGVFSPNDLCVGAVIIEEDGFPVGISAWGDDPETDEIDGMREGEVMSFKFWDNEAETVYSAIPQYRGDDNGEFQPNEVSILTLSAISGQEFIIPLSAGWNLISAPIQPVDPDMIAIWADVVEREHLILVKGQFGDFYLPEFGFINMDDWDARQGYQAKLSDADTLIIVGRPVPEDMAIPLIERWNIAAYLPEAEVDAIDAFANIEDVLILAKDVEGFFYSVEFGFSNMGDLSRTNGYLVKVTEDVDLVWNVPEERVAASPRKQTLAALVHFTVPVSTGNNMSLLLTGLPNMSGLEVAVISKQGIVVGAGRFDREGRAGLAVWGDDQTTETVDGLMVGKSFELIIWDDNLDKELSLTTAEFERSSLVYEPDGFEAFSVSMARLVPDEYFLSEAYPNPFNSTTTITYGLPIAASVSLKLYDLSGRQAATLVEGQNQAGVHTAILNAEALASGLYFMRLEAADQVFTQKVMLIR